MSLFENDDYQWRETYFVLYDDTQRPTRQTLEAALRKLGRRIEVGDVQTDAEGRFESLTVVAPDDYAGMDISCVSGDEVAEQVGELSAELSRGVLTREDRAKIKRLHACTGRLDVYHFERNHSGAATEDEELLDPGSLLVVLDQLAELCDGVVVDPQSGTFL